MTEIPITDKFWVKCKFDENFMEVSYIDNKGTSFEFIDPQTGALLFYKNNDIDITQDILNNIHNIKSGDKKEQLFLSLFSNLRLEVHFRKFQNSLFFRNISDNQIVAEYNLKNGYFYIDYYKIWSKFESGKQDQYQWIKGFLRSRLEYHLRLANTTPRACVCTKTNKLEYHLRLANTTPNIGFL